MRGPPGWAPTARRGARGRRRRAGLGPVRSRWWTRSSRTRGRPTRCCSAPASSRRTLPPGWPRGWAAASTARRPRSTLRGDELVAVRPALGDTVMVESSFRAAPAWCWPGPTPSRPSRRAARPAPVERVAAVVAGLVGGGAGWSAASRPRRAASTSARPTCWSRSAAAWAGPRTSRVVEAAGQGAGRRGGGHPRGGRRRLGALLDAGRADRQDGVAQAVRGLRHLRCDPAQGGDGRCRA